MTDGMKHMAHMMSSDMTKKMDAMTQEMNEELSRLSGDEFDSQFLHMTILHHQQAVEMAQLAQANAVHPELREMATKMLSDQQEEIRTMQSWQREWGYA